MFPCDVVVLASGVQTTELASQVQTYIPQQRSPGIVIKTTPCAEVLHNVAIIYAPLTDVYHQHHYLRQLADGSLSIGQGIQEGINRDDSQQHADTLLDRANAYFPEYRTRRRFQHLSVIVRCHLMGFRYLDLLKRYILR